MQTDKVTTPVRLKNFFGACNVLPFSCTHFALWRERPKVHAALVHAKKKDSRISLPEKSRIGLLKQQTLMVQTFEVILFVLFPPGFVKVLLDLPPFFVL